MANSSQAKKRARQSEVSRERNASGRSEMRTYLKQVVKAIEEGNKAVAATVYKKACTMVDGMVNKGLIHANKAARHKSRLNSRIKAISE